MLLCVKDGHTPYQLNTIPMLLCVKDGHTPYQLNTIPEITNNNCILQKKTTLKKL